MLILLLSLLSLLLRFFLLFFEFFDLFLQNLGLTAVGREPGEVIRHTPRCGETLAVQLFRVADPLERLVEQFQRRIELLRLYGLHRFLQILLRAPVRGGAEIEQRTSPDFFIPGTLADRLFVKFCRVLFSGKLFFPRLIVKLRRSRPHCYERQQRGQRQNRPPLERTLPEQQIDDEQQHRSRKQERKVVIRDHPFNRLLLRFAEPVDLRFKLRDSGIRDRTAQIDTSGLTGKLLEFLFIETAGGEFAVADALESPVLIRNRGRDARIAQSDHEKRNLPFPEFRDGGAAVAGELVSIGHEQNRPISRRRLESLQRDVDRALKVGSADRNAVGPELIDVLQKRRLVRRERTREKRPPGKCHKTEPVRSGFPHEFPEQIFGMFQPGRRDVGRPHALGHIEKDENIPAESLL